ncbi:MAG: UvrD-helicase domain-containing protein [Clostridia bacterium]|nr:UvrD-helicase domain-containing protein [Clostridia bacterium]
MTKQFLSLRRQLIEREFSNLNPRQFDAVTTVNGQVLVLAGAGSGKTTVLVDRCACILKYGDAYNSLNTGGEVSAEHIAAMESALKTGGDPDIPPGMLSVGSPSPWNILAITFTNKAAGELKERIAKRLGEDGLSVNASTFHSACLRILRAKSEYTPYSSHFTIYDTDDQKRVVKDCLREIGIDEKHLPPKQALSFISRQKDRLVSPAECAEENRDNRRADLFVRVYGLYDAALKKADAMDFDDIIVNTVELFRKNPDVLAYYRHLYRYIMVDEYQDTNFAQNVLVSLLAGEDGNLCVVGDDDQSIYKFRGATVENILGFDKEYPRCRTIRLEQNYRSTQVILDAANAVIANNSLRKGKNLWTDKEGGEKIRCVLCPTDMGEGDFIADDVSSLVASGDAKCSDFAVLYRMGMQSNLIERAFARRGVPYRIIGGHRFYDRAEIRDMISYLSLCDNPHDNYRLRRVINVPKRGIGDTTVEQLAEISSRLGLSIYEIICNPREFSVLTRSAGKLTEFAGMITELHEASLEKSPSELIEYILERTGYLDYLSLDPSTVQTRTENVEELKSQLVRFEEEKDKAGEPAELFDFLEDAALQSDIDNYNSSEDAVVLMTMHAAKGLEFNRVYIVGMENGIFPSEANIYDEEQLQEERRLAYVGITRARQTLTLTLAQSRTIFGRTGSNKPSLFLTEIPPELLRQTRAGYLGTRQPSPGSQRTGSAAGRPDPGEAVRRAAAKPAPVSVSVGDRVKHRVYGEGLVLSGLRLGNDSLVEVAFDTAGTKKLMAASARLEKL